MPRHVWPLIIGIALFSACTHNSAYYLKRGNQLAAAGKLADAEVNYRKAIQSEPNNGEAYLQLATVSERLRKPQDAYQALSQAVKLLPNRADVKVKLAELLLAAYLGERQRSQTLHDRIAKLCDEMLSADPASFDALRIKGHLAAAAGDLTEAGDFYAKANEVKASQPDVTLGWAEVLFRENRAPDAERLATAFIDGNKSYGPMYDLLYRYYISAKRPADAEGILKLKAGNNPDSAASHLELAAYYASTARENDMNSALRPMLDDPKKFPDAGMQVGDLYARLQRWDDALHMYEQGAAKDPKKKNDYLKHIADVWLLQGKGERASGVIQEILKAEPNDPQAKGVEASLQLALGNADNIAKATATLQDLVKQYPDDAIWHFNLGRALAAKGALNDARAQFLEAVSLRRNFLQPRLALIEMSEAKSDYKAALQYSNDALTLFPTLMRIRLVRAVSLIYTGQTQLGEAELARLEREFPADSEVQLQLGMVDLRQKKFADAEQHFRKLLQNGKDDPRPLRAMALTLEAENQVDKAVGFLQDELKKSPNSVAVRSTLAQTAAITGKYDIAIEQFQKLIALAPNSEQANLALGVVYRMKGDFPGAIAQFRKAHDLAPKDAAPLQHLGGALSLSAQNKEALSVFRQALQLNGNDGATLNNAAFLICETGGDLDEAMTMAQKALKLDAANASFNDTIGWIYLKKRLTDSAVQVFQSLTDKYPANATFRYHLGVALLEKGNKTEAGAQLKQALTEKPTDEVRRGIEAALARTA